VKAVQLDLDRERAQRKDAATELSRCAPRVQELQIALADQRREAEETAAQLREAKGQVQSLGSTLRETRKMYAECAHVGLPILPNSSVLPACYHQHIPVMKQWSSRGLHQLYHLLCRTTHY
jgi:hypothetical protein